MTRNLCFLALGLLLLVAGCKTVPKDPQTPWGEAYTDVVVPENYHPYDTPPFKREDSPAGKRIFGRYAYKNVNGMDKADKLAQWFQIELPKHGWTNQLDEIDLEKGTATLRYQKDEDKLVLKLAPDTRFNSSDRFSVLVVELNPPYGN
jgi:hypothetical protein